MPDEQIRATLGHEFGHLAHKDTDLILLISVGNMFVNMLVTFFNIGLWFFDIITTIMCLFMGGEDGFITHLFMIFSRFLAVITVNLLLRIWTGLGTLLVMKSSRGNEFEADEFAFQLGYGDQLCALLDYFSTHEQESFRAVCRTGKLTSGQPRQNCQTSAVRGRILPLINGYSKKKRT